MSPSEYEISLYDRNDDTCRDSISYNSWRAEYYRRRQETTVTHHGCESRKQESLALVTPIEISVVGTRNSGRRQRDS